MYFIISPLLRTFEIPTLPCRSTFKILQPCYIVSITLMHSDPRSYVARTIEAAVAPNQFMPKPRVSRLVCHLPQISYMSCRSVAEGKMMRVIMD